MWFIIESRCTWVSAWFLNAKWSILQLHHSENKIHFNEKMLYIVCLWLDPIATTQEAIMLNTTRALESRCVIVERQRFYFVQLFGVHYTNNVYTACCNVYTILMYSSILLHVEIHFRLYMWTCFKHNLWQSKLYNISWIHQTCFDVMFLLPAGNDWIEYDRNSWPCKRTEARMHKFTADVLMGSCVW